MQEEISLKSRKILPILLSVMATFGITTAVSVTASAAEVTKSPVQYKQTAQSGLATPKISKAESVYEGVKLSWNDVDGAALYRVYYKGKNGWTKLTDTTATSCVDNDVYSGGNYTYTVRCITEDGKHFASGYDSKGTKLTYIAAPELSKTESVNSGEKLTWNKVKGAEKYRVYFKNGKKWTRIGDTTSTSLVHKNVVSGRSYTYTVRCISGNAKSFTSDFNHNGTETTYIGTPQISNIESVNGGVKLSWSSVNGAEMYRVYYKGRNGWTKLVDTTETACVDSDVLSGNNYTYTVRCISNDARKHQSGYDKNGKSLKYIAAPKVTKTDVTYNSVNLKWNKVKGAEKYRVYRRNGNTWKRIADTTSTSVTDKNLSAEKSYTYTVRCITANGKKFASGYDSKGFTATTSPIPPVIFDKTSVTVDKGKTYTIKTTVADKSKPIAWSTSNAKVATVDQKGKVKAVGKGSAIITAEVDGIKTTCKVKVKVIKIYLSPSNQNANTYATGNTNEMAQCDKISAATAKALDRCGFEVMVAKSGTLMQKRCPESDKFGADIHMPIHTNASGSGNYTGGTRVFCLNSSGKKAAQAVCDSLGAITPGKDDAVIYKNDLYEINVPKALSLYVECEFHDTVTGSNWIRNNINEIGEAICKGLCKYYGYTYVAPAKNTKTTKATKSPQAVSSQSTTDSTQTVTEGELVQEPTTVTPQESYESVQMTTEPTQPETEPTTTVSENVY